ncbi:MAG: UDP-N-acetylmuramate--L-alanine ligase [Patescibacteria group bacterium]
MKLEEIKKIYFLGLGGVGVSALALLLKEMGKEVLGSDESRNEIIEDLRKKGIKVFVPQRAENIPAGIDLAVYSVAVREDSPERMRIKEMGIKQMSYPELLGILIDNKYGIGVSGTNGKTTVTAMLGKILLEADLDPTIIVGSKTDYLSGNSRLGRGEYFVFESDEYRRAFSHYFPKAAIVTYIGEDHLDYYSGLEEIKSAFHDYLARVPDLLVLNADDPDSLLISSDCPARKITFGFNEADYTAKEIKAENGKQTFQVWKGELLGEISLMIPGSFNASNALAALAMASELGVDFETVKKSLISFKGAWRRFDRLGFSGETEIIADYAHTPDSVEKMIQAAKEFFPGKKILIVFQPHQYSRTKNLFNGFVKSFDSADKAVISDIFFVKGRENPENFDVSSKILAQEIKKRGVDCVYGGNLEETEKIIKDSASEFSVVLVLGAGDIYETAKKLIE